jgi:aspartyl-tRNA(Asn)/glutamyl-tRNA(Gln) amidotransferase subunit B
LKRLLDQGGDPETIAKELGFEAIPASEVAGVLDEVIAANESEWRRYVAGEDKLQGLFIGKVKAATGGKADLKAVATSLRARREQEQQQT